MLISPGSCGPRMKRKFFSRTSVSGSACAATTRRRKARRKCMVGRLAELVNRIALVSGNQLFQRGDFIAQALAAFRVGDGAGLQIGADVFDRRDDVGAVVDRIRDALEMVV